MNTTLLLLVFFVITILIGIVLRALLKRSALMPYSVALLLVGICLGSFVNGDYNNPFLSEITAAFNLASQLNAELILFIFLPALVFESAFSLEVHLFKRMFSQIALLAIPGLVICTLLTALFAVLVLPWQWSIPSALMFGAIVSATDPVAVVALLKEMCSRARLQTLLEGESLLNDGTAIVLFTLFLVLAIDVQTQFDLPYVVIEFIRVVAIGAVTGLITGVLSLTFINRVFNDSQIEITLTLVLPYLVFYVAEHLFHASGVVAVVTLALIYAGPGRTRFSPEVIESLHHVWHSLSYLFNTLIFMLVGLVIAARLSLDELVYWPYLVAAYLAIFVIRAFAVTIMTPVLSRIGIGMTKEKSIVLVWGGLRGAVSMALALIVASNESLPQSIRDQILFLTAGIVVLSIVVNGSTMAKVMALLGLNKLPKAKQEAFAKVEQKIELKLEQTKNQLKADTLLQHINWHQVSNSVERQKLSKKQPVEPNVATEYLRKLLEAERQYYWNQFQLGLIGQRATQVLVAAIEKALDGEPQVYPRDSLTDTWEIPHWLVTLKSIPGLQKIYDAYLYRHQVICFESAKGVFGAIQSITPLASSLSHNKQLTQSTLTQLNQLQDIAKNRLDDFSKKHYSMVEKIESDIAARVLLNTERHELHNLAKHGLISEGDAEKLVCIIEKKMHKLKHRRH